MGEQINLVIDNIAAKLGVAAEHVYPMLIKQSYIDGTKAVIWSSIAVLIIIVSLVIIIKNIKILRKVYNDDCDYAGCESLVLIIVGAFLVFIFFLSFTCNIDIAINALGNPEWYAIQNIINQIK